MNDLIEQLNQGSQEAFRALVAQCSHNVISACYGLLGNVEDAEDVAQDVFIEVYRSVHRFRKESDLNTWIYRIAINKSLDLLRKRKRKKRIGDLRAFFHSKAKPADTPHQGGLSGQALKQACAFKTASSPARSPPQPRASRDRT